MNDTDDISRELDIFVSLVGLFVTEYATRKKPIDPGGPIPRMGHAEDVLSAARTYGSFVSGLEQRYKDLGEEDKNDARIRAAFWRSCEELEPLGLYEKIERNDVPRLLDKALVIAKGQTIEAVPLNALFTFLPDEPERRFYGRSNAFDAFTYCG